MALKNIFIIILLNSPLLGFCQWDTIFYPSGGFRIVNMEKLNKIYPDSLPQKINIVEEFFEFNSNGDLISDRKIFGKDHYLTKSWTDLGVKFFEEYINLPLGMSYQFMWDSLGNKVSQILSNGTATMIIEYHPKINTTKTLKENTIYDYSFDSLKISHPAKKYYAIEKEINKPSLHIKSRVIEFYENGQIKGEKITYINFFTCILL